MSKVFWNFVNYDGNHWIFPEDTYDGKPILDCAWERVFGEVVPGWFVIRTCGVDRCVNPYHMYLGNEYDTDQDITPTVRKKRLTDQQKKEILELMATKEMTQKKIAEKYGVDRSYLWVLSKKEKAPE